MKQFKMVYYFSGGSQKEGSSLHRQWVIMSVIGKTVYYLSFMETTRNLVRVIEFRGLLLFQCFYL